MHKNNVDPNIYDLKFLYASAQWLLSELVRQVIGGTMASAGTIIEYIQMPADVVVESIGDRKLVHHVRTLREEILVLLHSYYPEFVSRENFRKSLDRASTSAVNKTVRALWSSKLVHEEREELKLTSAGFREAESIIKRLITDSRQADVIS